MDIQLFLALAASGMAAVVFAKFVARLMDQNLVKKVSSKNVISIF